MENLAYLDTHLVVWLYSGNLNLIPKKIQALLNNKDLLISPIVRLELQYLYEIKRIKQNSNKILSALETEIGLNICTKDFNLIMSNAIKAKWTRDPFDRIIVANSAINNSMLITKDQTILNNYKFAIWSFDNN